MWDICAAEQHCARRDTGSAHCSRFVGRPAVSDVGVRAVLSCLGELKGCCPEVRPEHVSLFRVIGLDEPVLGELAAVIIVPNRGRLATAPRTLTMWRAVAQKPPVAEQAGAARASSPILCTCMHAALLLMWQNRQSERKPLLAPEHSSGMGGRSVWLACCYSATWMKAASQVSCEAPP